jgi:hypothetical protein
MESRSRIEADLAAGRGRGHDAHVERSLAAVAGGVVLAGGVAHEIVAARTRNAGGVPEGIESLLEGRAGARHGVADAWLYQAQRGGADAFSRQREIVEILGNLARVVVGLLSDQRQVIADAERPFMRGRQGTP